MNGSTLYFCFISLRKHPCYSSSSILFSSSKSHFSNSIISKFSSISESSTLSSVGSATISSSSLCSHSLLCRSYIHFNTGVHACNVSLHRSSYCHTSMFPCTWLCRGYIYYISWVEWTVPASSARMRTTSAVRAVRFWANNTHIFLSSTIHFFGSARSHHAGLVTQSLRIVYL
jgi:hypothetical protein